MPKHLLAKGARGQLVRRVQQALTDQGFDPQGVDEKFGSDTEAAVKAFQEAHSRPPTGKVDVDTWTTLLDGEVPTTQERALQLTAAFEGHGFSLAQGNWDGAGITWGIIGFTLLHGELKKIILTIFEQDPALVQDAFGLDTEELIAVMKSPKTVQMQFADSISMGATKVQLKEPWRSGFVKFGQVADVQTLQLKLADEDYGQPSVGTANELGLKTELGRALAFDIHVQNGGIKASAQQMIVKTLEEHPVTTEQEVRVIVANAVADASNQKFREDVRSRKLTIAAGAGKVHGEMFVLSNWGLDESTADS